MLGSKRRSSSVQTLSGLLPGHQETIIPGSANCRLYFVVVHAVCRWAVPSIFVCCFAIVLCCSFLPGLGLRLGICRTHEASTLGDLVCCKFWGGLRINLQAFLTVITSANGSTHIYTHEAVRDATVADVFFLRDRACCRIRPHKARLGPSLPLPPRSAYENECSTCTRAEHVLIVC